MMNRHSTFTTIHRVARALLLLLAAAMILQAEWRGTGIPGPLGGGRNGFWYGLALLTALSSLISRNREEFLFSLGLLRAFLVSLAVLIAIRAQYLWGYAIFTNPNDPIPNLPIPPHKISEILQTYALCACLFLSAFLIRDDPEDPSVLQLPDSVSLPFFRGFVSRLRWIILVPIGVCVLIYRSLMTSGKANELPTESGRAIAAVLESTLRSSGSAFWVSPAILAAFLAILLAPLYREYGATASPGLQDPTPIRQKIFMTWLRLLSGLLAILPFAFYSNSVSSPYRNWGLGLSAGLLVLLLGIQPEFEREHGLGKRGFWANWWPVLIAIPLALAVPVLMRYGLGQLFNPSGTGGPGNLRNVVYWGPLVLAFALAGLVRSRLILPWVDRWKLPGYTGLEAPAMENERASAPYIRMLAAIPAVIGAAIGFMSYRLYLRENRPLFAIYLLLGGIAGVWLALAIMDRASGKRFFRGFQKLARWEWIVLAAILLGSAWIRLYRLSDIPEGIWFDEAEFGMESQDILAGQRPGGQPVPPYQAIGFYSHNPSLSFYITAVFFKYLGESVFSLRLPIVLWGLVGVFFTYFLARMLFGRIAAVASTIFLGAMYWHVIFCRFNMTNPISPTCAVIGFFLFFKAEKTGRLSDYFASGLLHALSMHGYQPGAFPILAFGLVMGHRFFLHPGRFRMAYLQKLCLIAVGGYMVMSPLLAAQAREPARFARRMRETALWKERIQQDGKIQWEPFLEHDLRDPRSTFWREFSHSTYKHLLMFNYQSDWIQRHTIPHAPRFDFVSSALFVLGLAFCFYRFHDNRYFMPLAWLFLSLLAGILTLPFEAPQGARTLVATPACALLMGIAAHGTLTAIQGSVRKIGPILVIGLLSVMGIAVFAENWRLYFQVFMGNPGVWGRHAMEGFQGTETLVAKAIAAAEPGWEVFHDSHGLRQLSFLRRGIKRDRNFWTHSTLPMAEEVQGDLYFVLEPSRYPLPEEHWLSVFGAGTFQDSVDPFFLDTDDERRMNPYKGIACYTFHVPFEEFDARQGVKAHYSSHASETEPVRMVQKALSLAPASLFRNREAGFDFEWEGCLFIPMSGPYRFVWDPVIEADVRIDGASLDGTFRRLIRGWHNIEVRGTLPHQVMSELKIVDPGQTSPRTVPKHHLYSRPLPSQGLMGFYYSQPLWRGLPRQRQIDPVLRWHWRSPPVTDDNMHPVRNWSSRWVGYLHAEKAGAYAFRIETPNRVDLYLNGQRVDAPRHDKGVPIQLSPGFHPIDLWLERNNQGEVMMNLCWQPPEGEQETIPTRNLIPYYQGYGPGTPFPENHP